jgi:hypothetical protein
VLLLKAKQTIESLRSELGMCVLYRAMRVRYTSTYVAEARRVVNPASSQGSEQDTELAAEVKRWKQEIASLEQKYTEEVR